MALFNGKGKSTAWSLDSADDPADWTPSFSFMCPLDAALRCELCYSIFTAPVAVKECGHTFCSTCIRRYINQAGPAGQQCPKCRAKGVFDSSLQPQPALEAAAVAWRKARVDLTRKQEEESLRESSEASDHAAGPSSRGTKRKAPAQRSGGNDEDSDGSIIISSSPIAERRGHRAAKSTPRGAGASHSPVVIDEVSDDDDCAEEQQHEARARQSREVKRVKRDEKKQNDYRNISADDVQPCPICTHDFTMRALDKHLDKGCSPGDPEPSAAERGIPSKPQSNSSAGWFSRPSGSQASSRPAKKLLRPQYGMMKEKELTKLLQDASLPFSGPKERLVERHRQWVNLFNANLDASENLRKSTQSLKRDLAEWDRGMDAADKLRAKGGAITAGKAKGWAKKNEPQFRELTLAARVSNEKNKAAHAKPAAPQEQEKDGAGPSNGAGPSKAVNGQSHANGEDSQDYFAQLDEGEEEQEALMRLEDQ